MIKFFRSKDLKKLAILLISVSIIAIICGFLINPLTGTLILAICAIFCTITIVYTLNRYKNIALLNSQLDLILHGNYDLDLDSFDEGELSLLQSEIYKMTIMLREHSSVLTRDKQYLSDSMADIAHQLRTPLTSINMIIGFLGDNELDETRRMELMRELNTLLCRIDWLISTLLRISKIDAGTAEFKTDDISVKQLIEKTAELFIIPLELRNIELNIITESYAPYAQKDERVEGAADIRVQNTGENAVENPVEDAGAIAREDISFTGDMSWTTEALSNIIKNCMEHTPDGGKIEVAYSQNAIFTEIIISDNGCGIDEIDIPHLFERFYQGKNASPNSFGIGLALCRMIIAKQNGTIKAENNQDAGARFIIKFYHKTM